MRLTGFVPPPFVVWRIAELPANKPIPTPFRPFATPPTDEPGYEESCQYRLVPHAVFRNILLHSFFQWLVLTGVMFSYFGSLGLPAKLALSVIGLIIFAGLAIGANLFIMWIVNARPMQTIEALLQHAPRQDRWRYEEWFPTIFETRPSPPRPSTFRRRRWRALRITAQMLVFFLCAPAEEKKVSRGFPGLRRFLYPYRLWWNRKRRRRSQSSSGAADPIGHDHYRRLNRAKLGALTLRREDSSLHAFSAFAAITTFVPQRRRVLVIPEVHINFLLGYFSPIGYGFILCLATFCLYPIAMWYLDPKTALPRFPLMFPVLFWFGLGLHYLRYTLQQDFAAFFRNYFNARKFPQSMTRFANEQMARAPDLVEAIQSNSLSFFISVLLFGLGALYAGFLQSLG
jgi:hypothetical protein